MLFLDSSYPAHKIASQGYPYFATGFIFFAINMMYLGYYQSIEDYKTANKISLLRGYILLLICFYLMPELFGTLGVWLAVPAAELITVVYLLLFIVRRKRK